MSPGARRVRAAEPAEVLSIIVRMKSSAGQGGLDRLAEFAHAQGLEIVGVNVAEKNIALSGTVAQMSRAFAVDLGKYESPKGAYRGCEGHLHLPAGLAEIVDDVVGLVEGEIENIEREIWNLIRCWEKVHKGQGVGSYLPLDLTVPTSGPHGPVNSDEFSMVGIFDVGVLAPQSVSGSTIDDTDSFGRLLDNMASSPGAFDKVRLFKCLNSGGGVETNIPISSSGTVWPVGNSQPDFTVTLAGLAAVVQRGLIPFIVLGFFPATVSSSPITPPASYADWQTLVQAFLSALANALATDARFKGAPTLDKWWFEVWNEPNIPDFWTGQQQDYFNLYQATSDAVLQWQTASGVTIQLGGPAVAWDMPSENLGFDGPGWMQAFLNFVANNKPKCDFVSLHRKGSWSEAASAGTDVDSVVNAADQTATMAKNLGFQNLSIVNDEADMRAGVSVPYLHRMQQNFAAWLSGIAIAYDSLSSEYSPNGFRFLTASDDAHLDLVNGCFDGIRSIMTLASVSSATQESRDLLKVPVYNFYELLRLLGDRHGSFISGSNNYYPHTDLFHAITVTDNSYIGSIFAVFPRVGDTPAPWNYNYSIVSIPWPLVNVAIFEIDAALSNGFAAAGGILSVPFPGAAAGPIRQKQELSVVSLTQNVPLPGGTFHDQFTIQPYSARLYWITPFKTAAEYTPASPSTVTAIAENGNAIVQWTPHQDSWFYSYEVYLLTADGKPQGSPLTPNPLRAALWVDTAPAHGTRQYGVRAVSASGVPSALTSSNPVTI